MTRRLLICLALLSLPTPAQAQNDPWCEELWLSRNTVLDRAGQCFDTALGRAVFDNADCSGAEVTLFPLDAEIVRRLEEMEAGAGCAIDTSVTEISPANLATQRRLGELWTVPVRGDSEHGCMGYRGPIRALHAGMSEATTVLGHLEPGQTFGFVHQPMPPDWEYIRVSDEHGVFVTHGWVRGLEMTDELCAFMAG
jgi:hypothetical protein